MTALLDLPEVRQRVHRLSVAEYHRVGGTGAVSKNVELLRGIVITKMSKSPLHEAIRQKLLMLLLGIVPKGYSVRSEGPLTFHDSEPEHDISVVSGQPDDWVEAHPSTAELVIEVAVSSAAVDLVKAEIYAEAGIAEYWLVFPEQRTVEIYQRPGRAGYESKSIATAADILQCRTVPAIRFRVADILPRAR